MSIRRVQYNNGPAALDIINFVPGNYFSMRVTLNHDITGSTFESEILDAFDVVISAFSISGVVPLTSGVFNLYMLEADTALVASDSTWYLDEIREGKRNTLMAGNVEVYTK